MWDPGSPDQLGAPPGEFQDLPKSGAVQLQHDLAQLSLNNYHNHLLEEASRRLKPPHLAPADEEAQPLPWQQKYTLGKRMKECAKF